MHSRLPLLKLLGMLLIGIVFVAGVPVALQWTRQAMPTFFLLLVPLGAISLALGLWKRRW